MASYSCGQLRLFHKYPIRWMLRRARCSDAAHIKDGKAAVSVLGLDTLDGSSSTSALSGKTYGEVLRGWLVFKLLTFDWIVRNSHTLYNVSERLLGVRLTRRLLRSTVAGQFLGGFSEEEARRIADTNTTRNMCSIWNFSTEQDLSDYGTDLQRQEAKFDEINCRYLKSIHLSGQYSLSTSPVKMAAVKLTAIVHPGILSKLSQMLVAVRQYKQGSSDMCDLSAVGDQRRREIAEWMSSFQVPDHLSRLQEVSKSHGCDVTPFTVSERDQLKRLVSRLDDIGESARKEGVRVLVDAEESRLQPAIHHLAVHHMMARYNHTEPVIYNTIQMYLKNSLEALLVDIATSKSTGFSYGVKLVRGAYMVYEKNTAGQLGHDHPCQPNKEATDMNYDRGVRCVMKELACGVNTAGVGGLVVASHNRHSVQQAVQLMHELRIPRDSGAVCFGQLLGMADYISYALASNGYCVQKILAYGDSHDVIPFLVRRAQENDKTSQNAQLERQLYAQELKKRRLV